MTGWATAGSLHLLGPYLCPEESKTSNLSMVISSGVTGHGWEADEDGGDTPREGWQLGP